MIYDMKKDQSDLVLARVDPGSVCGGVSVWVGGCISGVCGRVGTICVFQKSACQLSHLPLELFKYECWTCALFRSKVYK